MIKSITITKSKTAIGIFAIRRVLNAKPNASIIVVVPSEPVKKQWKADLAKCTSPFENVNVITVKRAATNYKKLECTLLVIDEIHIIPTKKNIYAMYIPHNFILGLTATYKRLDGRHSYVNKIAPVIDEITLREGVENGWTSKHNIYCVLCDIPNMSYYESQTKRFKAAFEFFGYDFNAPMNVLTDKEYRKQYIEKYVEKMACAEGITDIYAPENAIKRKELYSRSTSDIMGCARVFIESMSNRKNFIYHHPKKLEIAKKIIEAYKDKKGMTFWCTVEDAERVPYGDTYACVQSNRKNENGVVKNQKYYDSILTKFKSSKSGVINTVRKLNTGFNCPEIEYGIMAGFNSSETTSKQSKGRIIRVDDMTKNKDAKIFYIVLRDCQDQVWFSQCIGKSEYLTILEQDLDDFLAGKPITFAPNKKAGGSRY